MSNTRKKGSRKGFDVADLSGEEEHVDGGILVEAFDDRVAGAGGDAAIEAQERDGWHVGAQQVLLDDVDHGAKLAEDERAVDGDGAGVGAGSGRHADAAVEQQLTQRQQLGRVLQLRQVALLGAQLLLDRLLLRMQRRQHQLRVVAHLAQVLQSLVQKNNTSSKLQVVPRDSIPKLWLVTNRKLKFPASNQISTEFIQL